MGEGGPLASGVEGFEGRDGFVRDRGDVEDEAVGARGPALRWGYRVWAGVRGCGQAGTAGGP